MHHALSKPLFAWFDNTILSYYSHKNPILGKQFFNKWSDRVYWTDNITENFVTECLIKVQTVFESICGKSQQDRWIKFTTKKYLWSVVYQHKKQPLSKVSACCRCSLPSWLLVGASLVSRCNCNNHYYFSGLLQHRLLDIAITNMNAGLVQVYQTCKLVGTSLQIWLLVRSNC